jgi:hypothetical protein
MRNRLFAFATIVLVFFSFGCDSATQNKEDEAAIREAYSLFKEAVQAGDGQGAASLVTQETLDYYQEICNLALSADRERLMAAKVTQRFTALAVRGLIAPKDLAGMTGKDLFSRSIQEGWIGQDRISDEHMGNVVIEGDRARVVVTRAGANTSSFVSLVRHDGRWVIDMMPTLEMGDQEFARTLKESGMSEEEFMNQALESMIKQKDPSVAGDSAKTMNER